MCCDPMQENLLKQYCKSSIFRMWYTVKSENPQFLKDIIYLVSKQFFPKK